MFLSEEIPLPGNFVPITCFIMIEKEVGEGICVTCGSKIENHKCPICDRKKLGNV